MSTSIPSSFSFEMLSRLPANSFLLNWVEVRPDQTPQGNKYVIGQRQRICFVLRGAPNEFMLNTNINLCGNAYIKVKQTNLNNSLNIQTTDFNVFDRPPVRLSAPYHFFQSSRESFNAGSLPYLDNQDMTRSHIYNDLRYSCVRRNRDESTGGSMYDIGNAFNSSGQCLSLDQKVTNEMASGAPIRMLWNEMGQVIAASFGKSLDFQIPLGTYSNFVNSHSVIPLGLCSSYAVNGWQIELETTEQSGDNGRCYTSNKIRKRTVANIDDGEEDIDPPVCIMKDIRIYVPVIKVLDPSVMASILSLYEKREMVNLGGVQFPLSMRINSIAYRTSSFPLFANQTDYFFRISGTDRSVRAVAWWVYDRTNLANTGMLVPIKLSRLETSIGNEHIHEVIEDTDGSTNNVSNFIVSNLKRSASLFSVLPYYQEGVKFDGQQEDYLNRYNNALEAFNVGTAGGSGGFRRAICYGAVSFENLDRREGDYSGSFQASGKDLTNAGAIEMRMRLEQPVGPTNITSGTSYTQWNELADVWSKVAIVNTNLEIVFMYAYDSIMEVSPQAVMDITNASL